MAADQIDDDHRGIPRDANGVPIFLNLPPAIRAKYSRKLGRCEAAWRATSDPAFLIEAMILTFLHRQPLELWLSEAVCDLLPKRRTKGHVTRAYNAAVRRMRHDAVIDARRRGATWENAYEGAAEALAGTRAAGKADTMKAAYIEVKADIAAGRGALYRMPKMPNKKLGDAVGRKPSPR